VRLLMDVGLFGCSGQKTCENVGTESYFGSTGWDWSCLQSAVRRNIKSMITFMRACVLQ
jgi:hypothetical protein